MRGKISESVRDKGSILRTLITLSIPTILEEVLSTLLQYVDTAMVGSLGENATAAISVTTTITWVVNSIPHGAAVALLALIARNIGADKKENITKYSKQAVFFILVCTFIVGVPSLMLGKYIPEWMGAAPDICESASRYFMIISLPMLFRVTSSVLGSVIRATKDTKTPMYINLLSNLLNIGLNMVFIFGLDWNVTGAAISSAISYTVGGILMFVAYRRNRLLYWKWEKLRDIFDWEATKEVVCIGMPVMGNSLTSCFGYVIFARLVSGMGTRVFAAHSLAVTAETLFYIPGYGLRTATSTLVGIALGEQDEKKLDHVCKVSIYLTVAMMFLSGMVLYFIAVPLMKLFTPVEEVALLGADMLKLVAFSEPFFGLMIVLEGIFNGLGKNQYAFVIETASMWGVRILFSYLCVVVWKLDLQAVWYCMIMDNVCKAVLLWIAKLRYGSGKSVDA